MSEQPVERNRDSKNAAKENLEKPLDKQDPTEPVKLAGSKESKGADI